MQRSLISHKVSHFSRLLQELGALKSVKCLRLLSAVLLGALLLLGAGDDSARIDRLGHQMMCVCGCNQILLECNHVGCSYSSRMRSELVAAVDAGDSDGAVLQTFIQKYGTTVLAAPTMIGWVNRAAWVMPYAALAFGILLVAFVVRVWRNRPLPARVGVPAPIAGAELDRFRAQARKETDL
jgi:cytochrome c-type biogenesis protein CcmH/NrfF